MNNHLPAGGQERRLKRRHSIFRVLLKIVVSLLALVLLILAAITISWMIKAGWGNGLEAMSRLLKYGITEIDDYKYYPARFLQASDTPYRYPENSDNTMLEDLVPGDSGEELDNLLEANDTRAFLVIKNDAIVYERYFQGFSQSTPSQLFSATKSVTSVLLGMAIEDGYIESIDQPITDFVPELEQSGFSTVTLRHLVTMTSGSDYIEDDNPFGIHPLFNYTPDIEELMLDFKMKDIPGEVFRYKTGDTALIGWAMERALYPMTITEYAQNRLWSPLGMEYDGIWSLDRENGLEKDWCCLALTARDLAKIGSLYLHKGFWQGRQILSSDWIEQSTAIARIDASRWSEEHLDSGRWNYGYYWWLVSKTEGDFLANGKNGQFLYVNPRKDIVIVRLGWRMGKLDLKDWLSLFLEMSNVS